MAIIGLLFNVSFYAQTDTISVTESSIDATFFQAFEVNWIATKHFKDKDSSAIIYKVEERLEMVEEESKKLWKFTQYWNDEKGKNIFTTVRTADYHTLEYAAFHTGSAPGVIAHLDFNGRHVSGFTAFDAHKKAKQIGSFLEVPAFASFGGLLYTMILKTQHKKVRFPTFSWGGENPILNYEEIDVKGEEMVQLLNGKRQKASILKTSKSPRNTFYINADQPPYFLKLLVESKDGDSYTLYEVENFKILDE